jgi:hypothetical protein
LGRVLQWAQEGGELSPEAAMRADRDLTVAMTGYLTDLHFGQIDPRRIQENFTPRAPDSFDPAARLRRAVMEGRLPEAVREAAPQYRFTPSCAGSWRSTVKWRSIRFSANCGGRNCLLCRTASWRSGTPTSDWDL